MNDERQRDDKGRNIRRISMCERVHDDILYLMAWAYCRASHVRQTETDKQVKIPNYMKTNNIRKNLRKSVCPCVQCKQAIQAGNI